MKLFKVRQKLVSAALRDIPREIHRQMDRLDITVPDGDIAITAGSRGIANISLIVKSVGRWLRAKGARPFVVACMGSHNGATAEGQRNMLASLGIHEDSVGMDIRADMDVVKIGAVGAGDVYMDRHCHASAGVVVVNRIKLHTCFPGPVQSGLTKMMVVGMGKIRSARTFHSASPAEMKDMLIDMGRRALDSGRILAGVAILEDGYDQTAEIHALRPDDIPREEPGLLDRHRTYFPRLPVEALNVLVVDEIGKNYSGSGMDTHVIGRRGIRGFEDLEKPDIQVIAALGLAEKSQGNAFGVGLADFITRRLRDAIDEKKTLTNVLTSGDMIRAKIPATLPTDEELLHVIRDRFGDKRWMFIPNTLHVESLAVSEDLAEELRANPACDVASEPVELAFREGRHELAF